MMITIDTNSKTSIYLQIYEVFRNKILNGDIKTGTALPSERKLSQQLGVNRSTVMAAYDLLKSDALIESQPGRGTYVVYSTESLNSQKRHTTHHDWDRTYRESNLSKHDNIIEIIMTQSRIKGNFFFAGGLPSNKLIPNESYREITTELMQNSSLDVLSNTSVSGVHELKKEIKNIMLSKGVNSSMPEQLITSGSQQALDLVFKTFIKSGDTVLVEEPTFFGTLQLLRHYGANIITIPMDEHGMITESLDYMIKTHNPKFIYTIPTFHNPTGISMSLTRRHELVDISNKYNIPVIEDDPYSSITFEDSTQPPLKSLDRSNQIIYISTFSKTISLGLRIGWITASPDVIKHLVKSKQISDLHVNTLNQYTTANFISSKKYHSHLKRINQIYKHKRDLMIKALEDNFEGALFKCPKGGFYIWVELPHNISMRSLFEESMKNNVLITPGYHFMKHSKDSASEMRLNFTYPDADEIAEGIKILADCYHMIKRKN